MKNFDVPLLYRSNLLGAIKSHRKQLDKRKKDFSPTKLTFENTSFIIPRFFGFCYGVENAIEIAYKTIKSNPNKRIFLLSEMIHNPNVNKELKKNGIKILMDTKGNEILPLDELSEDDIVLIPAFGTTLKMMEKLRKKKVSIDQYETTCPFVEKVWKKSKKIGEQGYTIIVHGKSYHEETRATFSRTSNYCHSLIILNMEETQLLAQYIKGEKNKKQFYIDFQGKYSEGFNPEKHLNKIGVVNQTTMLASGTQSIAEYLKGVMKEHYNLNNDNLSEHFADYRDTLCYATNDNQNATLSAIEEKADLAIVIGGYNSSNTTQLYTLCKTKFNTVYISSIDNILENGKINDFDIKTKKKSISDVNIISETPKTFLMSSGASCPDAVVENVIKKIVLMRESEEVWKKLSNHYINEIYAYE